jgi:hypothetical protein
VQILISADPDVDVPADLDLHWPHIEKMYIYGAKGT